MKSKKPFIFFCVICCIMIAIYTYYSMYGLIFSANSSITNISRAGVVILSVMSIVISGHITTNNALQRMWYVWILYYIFHFLVLGMRGEGYSNIFQVCFAPCSYLFMYVCTKLCNTTTYVTSMFYALFVIVTYMIISSIFFKGIILSDADSLGGNNLVFYLLCLVPYAFLIQNSLIKHTFIIVMFILVIITLKRSALISICIIILLYIVTILKTTSSRKKFRYIAIISVIIFASLFVVNTYLGSVVDRAITRVSSISEDQGTGRIPLYYDVITNMVDRNDPGTWVFGNGIGSIRDTRHTNAHNDALQMLYEYGIIGMLLYFVLIYIMFKRTKLTYRKYSKYYMSYASSCVIVIMLGLVSNLVVFYSYFAFITALWGYMEGEISKSMYKANIHVMKKLAN